MNRASKENNTAGNARKEAYWQKRYDTLIDNKNTWMAKASQAAAG